MGDGGIMVVMGDHDDRGPVLVQLREHPHHFGSVFGVQITCRLIGQYYPRMEYHGAGYGDTLLLTATQLMWKMLGPVTDVHPFHDRLYTLLAL